MRQAIQKPGVPTISKLLKKSPPTRNDVISELSSPAGVMTSRGRQQHKALRDLVDGRFQSSSATRYQRSNLEANSSGGSVGLNRVGVEGRA